MATLGDRELRLLATQLRLVEHRGLEQELRQAQQDALRPLEPAIRANAATSLPRRGGYAAIMAREVRVGVTLGLRGRLSVRAHVYAMGRSSNRDVRRVNAGRLRHPVFANRDVWRVTVVRPGFVVRAVDDLDERVWRESLAAIDRTLAKLRRG